MSLLTDPVTHCVRKFLAIIAQWLTYCLIQHVIGHVIEAREVVLVWPPLFAKIQKSLLPLVATFTSIQLVYMTVPALTLVMLVMTVCAQSEL